MRCVRTCLTAIVLLMVPCQSANADIQTKCATIAAKISNTNGTDVDAWLARYREAYAWCRSQHEVTDGPPARGPEQADVLEPGGEKTATKSANKKAVFKNSKVMPATLLGKYPSPKVSRIEKTPPKPTPKHRKLANPKTSKTTKKVEALRVRTPLKSPAPASKPIRAAKATKSIGAESWRINCSERFGGFSKNSEWYISSSGKRVSCVIRE
jgi:hypothetical protein